MGPLKLREPWTRERQADYDLRVYLTDILAGVRITIVYDCQGDGADRSDKERNFGLFTFDGHPKPASAFGRPADRLIEIEATKMSFTSPSSKTCDRSVDEEINGAEDHCSPAPRPGEDLTAGTAVHVAPRSDHECSKAVGCLSPILGRNPVFRTNDRSPERIPRLQRWAPRLPNARSLIG
jgi:hypothetical protein